MSARIRVSSSFTEGDNNGCFLRVQSYEQPPRAWSKWYPDKGTASIDGERLGLTERMETPIGVNLIVRRRFKTEAAIDPGDLIHFNFAPVIGVI